MANRATIPSVEPGEEIEYHLEGVALFSRNSSCFGMSLEDIIDEVAPQVTEYGESVEMSPHEDCISKALDGGPDEHIVLLENSVWLVDFDCLVQENSATDVKYLLRTFPKTGNAIIWIDEDLHDPSPEDVEMVKTFSKKPAVVQSRTRLLDKLADYIEYSANPYCGCGSIVDWRNEVNRLQRTIG